MSTTATTAPLPADLREAFDDLVADAVGDFRPTPLARLMARHLGFFAELRRRGASWAQTAALLAAAGVIGSNGAFTAEVLRATFTRAAADAARRKRTGRNATKRSEANRNAAKRDATKRNATERDKTNGEEARDDALTDKHRMRGAPALGRPKATRHGTTRDAASEPNADPAEHGLADLFRRAAFLDDPANRR